MNIKITGRSIEVTDAMKDYIEKRLERLEKFEGKNTDVNVVCSVEREDQIAEIQINHDGEFLRVEERNADFYAAIDLALDRAERQLRKEKEKLKNKQYLLSSQQRAKNTSMVLMQQKLLWIGTRQINNFNKCCRIYDIIENELNYK